MRNSHAIVLRKVRGVFGALWQGTSVLLPSGGGSAAVNGRGLLAALGTFGAVLLAPLMLLAVIALVLFVLPAPPAHVATTHLPLAGVALAGTTEEMKKLLTELGTTVTEFKAANDERLKQLEAKGTADPLLVNKVEQANAAITRIETQLSEQKAALREMETAQARVSSGANQSDAAVRERAQVRQFLSMVQNKPLRKVTVTDDDVTTLREYADAFENHLRSAQINNSMSVGSSPEGGFWVTPDLSGRIVEKVYETSPVRQIASEQTIGTDALEGPNDQDEAGYSGWVGETAPRTTESTTPNLGKWRIPVAEVWAMPKTTQKNLDDSQNDVEKWLEKKVADKLSRVENAAFVNGDGVNKPRGFMTYPTGTTTGKINQLKTGVNGGFAATLPGNKLIDLVFSVKDKYRANAKFAMHRLTVAEIRKLVDGQGNYLWQRDFSSERGGTVLGYGIAELNDMVPLAATVASLSVAFGDFAEAYQIVNRQGIRVIRDNLTQKGFVLFYTTRRTGGDVLNFEALSILNFST
jgi:HK97 family phage major capsid protein